MTAKTITGNESFWGTIKLSADAIALINASPTLVMELLDYSNAVGVTAGTMGIDTGTGTGTGWNGSAIFFAQNWNTLPTTTIVGQLAHEIGHFENATADIAFDDEYRPAATDQSITADDVRAMMGLHREGEAAYNNWVVQQEILKATSSDGSGKGGTEIYLAGDGVYSTGPSNLQSILDTQHTSDVSGKLTASQEKNAMIEDAMHVFAPLPTSEDGTSYYNYYMKVNGAANPAQAPALGASGITFNDPNENGNFTTMGDTFSSGQSVTQSFSGSSLLTSVTKDQFGNVLTQTTYSHNADGSYIANVYDGQGHATDQDQFHSDGSEVAYHFNSNGTQNATVYNAQGNETEQATFGTNGVKTQDLFYDASTGRETQENDINADSSQVDHIFNANGTQNTAVFNASGHETEYATFGANGVKTQDVFYDANSGRETQENDINADGSQADHIFNTNGTQNTAFFNASGHETEYATFGANGVKTQDLLYDASSGRETQEYDINTDGSQIDHIFNANGTQNTAVFNAAGHETEYATFGANGVKTQDLFYDASTGRETQENDINVDGSQTDHIFNANGTQNTEVVSAAGHETEYATFGANGVKTQDLFYDATTGRETQENDINADGSQVDHIFNANGTQNTEAFNSAGHETEYATFGANGVKTQDLFYDAASGRETQENDISGDGSQVDHLFNANGTQTAYAFNAAGHETEQATFGTNGKITQDLVFDGASGRELQETDYNTDGSGVAHVFNPDGTQNAAVFDPSGHVSEYATYGANGKMTTDAYYNSDGRETQLNEYSGNQTTVHVINADNSQTATVYNSSGHETEYAEFNTSGHKTDDYFFDGTTGRETEYDQYGNNSSMTAHLFNSDNTQNAIIFNGNGQELEYDSFDSSGKLTGFTQFTYGAGGGYDAVAYGPTGYETGWADYANNNTLISSGGGQYNFTLGNEYDGGSDDFDFGSFEEDMGYSADFGFSF
ncbi:hypothetical protein [uncultured Caballeronia sp.]|jgi:hypothetical protein|uniref:hypothetical protein n=1 Tax=uncultured Caballeronia sp. TaxID=1827198 RepID=UPI00157653B0